MKTWQPQKPNVRISVTNAYKKNWFDHVYDYLRPSLRQKDGNSISIHETYNSVYIVKTNKQTKKLHELTTFKTYLNSNSNSNSKCS